MPSVPRVPTLYEAVCKDCGWFELRHDADAADQSARAHAATTDHLVHVSGTDPAGRLYRLGYVASFERAVQELPPAVAAVARARRRRELDRAQRRRAARKRRASASPSGGVTARLVRPAAKREAAVMAHHHKVCCVLTRAKKPLSAREIAQRAGLRLGAVQMVLTDRRGWAPWNRRLRRQKVDGTTVYSYKVVDASEWPSRFFHDLRPPKVSPA
jgi:hypothetical protein